MVHPTSPRLSLRLAWLLEPTEVNLQASDICGCVRQAYSNIHGYAKK